jgi:hypothetical protein
MKKVPHKVNLKKNKRPKLTTRKVTILAAKLKNKCRLKKLPNNNNNQKIRNQPQNSLNW